MIFWMRKHMKAILIGIIVLVVPTFILWGGYRSGGNRGGGESEGPVAVATVGDVPIMSTQYRQQLRAELARRAQQSGQEMASFEDAAADGTAERVLDGLIDSILVGFEVERRGFDFDRDFLVEQLKQMPDFRDDDGNFDPVAWNTWISDRGEMNWNAVYAELEDRTGRRIVLQEVMSAARVLDSDVRRQFLQNFTKLQVKAVKVDPEIEPTGEQVQAQYDEDPTRYQAPESRNVEFVAVSLKAPRPALVDELVDRLRQGEDFGELAKAHSDAPRAATTGGEMDWVEEREGLPDSLKAMFEAPVGTVSAPIEYIGSYLIYSVEEERVNEETGARERKARQIVIRPKLDDAERQAREERADALLLEARAAGDLAGAARDTELPVQALEGVSVESTELDGIDRADVRKFARGLTDLHEGDVSEVILGSQGLYVAKVTQYEPPAMRPLADVLEDVREDTINAIRRSPERREEVKALGENMAQGVSSAEELVARYPDMNLEIQETKEFTRRDFLWSEGLYVQSVDIFESLAGEAPGTLAGPLQGFQGEAYFVELVKETPPSDEDWENEWPMQERSLRESTLANKRNLLLMDYLAHLRERAGAETPVQRNYLALANILGTNQDAAEEDAADAGTEGPDETGEAAPGEGAEATADDTAASDAEPGAAEETVGAEAGDGTTEPEPEATPAQPQ